MNELEIARKCAAAMFDVDTASKGFGISVDVTDVGQAAHFLAISR